MMRAFLQYIFLMLLLILSSASIAQEQDEDAHYPKKLTVKLMMGPTYLSVDYGFHLQNQFEIELGKYFSLSAAYGIAHAYGGLDDVQRWYIPPDIDIMPDDHFRDQSMIFTNLGMQLTPLNLKHHKLFIGMGPSINFYNLSKAEILPYRDSIAFVMTNSKSSTVTYNFFGGYDLILGDHIVLGLSFYYLKFKDGMYSVMLSGGYRF